MNLSHHCAMTFLVIACISSGRPFALGEITSIDVANGPDDDAYASGQILNAQNNPVAEWSLSTSVAETDFRNIRVRGGDQGLEYTMRNTTPASEDSNLIRFSTTQMSPDRDIFITVAQSVYDQGGYWNGGWNAVTEFELSWDSSKGVAQIVDPSNQLLGLNDGDYISSPTTIQLSSNQVYNRDDAWSIELPENAMTVDLDWSAVDPPVDGTSLNYEWVSFSTDVVFDPRNVRCDSDGDFACQLNDIRAFYNANGSSNQPDNGFDFSGDGVIDSLDLPGWLNAASLPSNAANSNGERVFHGDVNLDFRVDSTDLGLLLINFGSETGSPELGVGWEGGDVNMDGDVNSSDLGWLLGNFDARTPVAALSQSVPEPGSAFTVLFASLAFLLLEARARRS